MKKIIKILGVFSLCAMNASAASPGVNIVINGDFETVQSTNPFFPPWQFTHGFSAFINEPRKAASGNNCVFIGSFNTGGDLWQALTTVVGQTYEFSFYERGDDPSQSLRQSLLNVFWGNQLVDSYTNSNFVSWNHQVFDLVATSTTTRIDFQNADPTIGATGNPGLDAVSVIAVAPEPTTVGLMAVGFLIFLGKQLWRSKTKCQILHKIV